MQAQRDIIFELRRIAFDMEMEPNNSGSIEKRKSMYTRDYKKLGFIVSLARVPRGLMNTLVLRSTTHTHTHTRDWGSERKTPASLHRAAVNWTWLSFTSKSSDWSVCLSVSAHPEKQGLKSDGRCIQIIYMDFLKIVVLVLLVRLPAAVQFYQHNIIKV